MKHEVDQAAIDKATAAQKVADEKARAKEAQQSDATGNPTVSLAAEGASPSRVAGESGLKTLEKGHTYRDRVVAQAEALGIPVTDDMTLEYIMWLIRMKASS